ncbi:MAG: large conductance mechanosensitive channel protein MscL [Planctomycetota bacterium]
MKILTEFKEFAMKGNMVDLAVGLILGAAFGAVVTSLVENIMMPPLGYAIGGVDFSELTVNLAPPADGAEIKDAEAALEAAKGGEGDVAAATAALKAAKEGVKIKYGLFLNSVIRFLIQAVAVFAVIKVMNNLNRKSDEPKEEPEPELTTDQKLLEEIRDALVARPS